MLSVSRKPWDSVVARAAGLVEWLRARPETHITAASHSAWLLAMFNAVLTMEDGDWAFISPDASCQPGEPDDMANLILFAVAHRLDVQHRV